MRLLLINQYYWPDMAATAQMMVDLCEHLARQGHDVHVLCSRGKYDDHTAKGRPPRYELHQGVHIHRVTATGFGKQTMLGRMLDYLSFHLLIGLQTLLRGWRYDVIITLTTPPLVGVYATPVHWLTRTRHVGWAMDLHPDCEFELGVFRRSALLPRLLDWLNGLHFRHATKTVALGPHMAQRLRDKGVRADRLAQISVWGHDLPPDTNDAAQTNPLREELGWRERFVVMYSGNAGIIHSFDAVCAAAWELRDDRRFVFLFVGGGRRMDEIALFAQTERLDNIVIRPYFPRAQLRHSLTLADVHLITMRDGMAGVAVPCKLYGVMAAGRPALFVGPERCETADQIRDHDCGMTFATTDGAGLAQALRTLADDPARCRQMGAHARAAFESSFSAAVCTRQWQELLEGLP